MLTGKQKRFLRHEAHHSNAIFQIGKDGLHENQIIGIAHRSYDIICLRKEHGDSEF